MKALFLHWPLIAHEPKRVLDDLARCTPINTLPISLWLPPPFGAGLLLPSADVFEDLPVPATPEQYDVAMRFVELAQSKGFCIASHVPPLFAYMKDL